MKIIEKYKRLLITFGVLFFFLNLALPAITPLVQSESDFWQDNAYAEDDDDDDDDDDEEGEGEEEEAGIDADAAFSEGYAQFPESLANEANPNMGMAKPDAWFIPIGKFPLFGLSNRDAIWVMAEIHILLASFIFAGGLFIVVAEATGAPKDTAMKKMCALLTIIMGGTFGAVIGMMEIMLGGHGALLAVCGGGAAAAAVVSIMILMGSINNSNKNKMALIIGGAIGMIIGGVFGHGGIGAGLGLAAGISGAFWPGFVMLNDESHNLERMAHELMKVVAVCFSFTALSGGAFLFLCIAYYPTFMGWLTRGFPETLAVWYPAAFIIETVFMYLYYYTWGACNNTGKKHIHLLFGILLLISGAAIVIISDAPAGFMLTPTKIGGSLKEINTFGEWAWVNNFTWWPMNFHRLVGNLTYGGFIVGFISAIMYLWSDNDEDKAFYDWQGYVGNALGLAFMLPLPIMGYIYSKECYMYDAAIGMYIMSDRLSMFMLMQGLCVGLLFVGANYYMYLSMKRVPGGEKYLIIMKVGFVLLFIASAIWYAPRHWFATMQLEPYMLPEGMTKEAFIKITELPGPLSFLALMNAKNLAAVVLIFVSLGNWIMYNIACTKGGVPFGKINPVSQYVLIFLAFTDLWLMTLMGALRELARKDWHVYKVFQDRSVDAYTPTLAHASNITTWCTWIVFALIIGITWMQLKYVKTHDKSH